MDIEVEKNLIVYDIAIEIHSDADASSHRVKRMIPRWGI